MSERWIAETARVAADAEVGLGTVVEAGATIGAGCKIGHHVVIHQGARIGE